ncbi:MAG: bifunctional hydroxymethylpyrimidine kinase/phosphomethylpyrimidine kinase [Candidatus Dormibacteraeota bacterium]|nr:bifunctional hydroxymethylpyrimidine kinase/phosphomethylpyrimidine kinase [Candidatus Dormibacteraeota bacterium]
MAEPRTPTCLTIATSDSGGGAGVQADVKAFAAAGCHGATVIVGLTAQNTVEVAATFEVPAWFITAQLDAVFNDIGIDALKTGALQSRETVDAVAAFLERLQSAGALPPLVIDPVLRASSGAALLPDDALEALIDRLLPLSTVITPNHDEAVVLARRDGSAHELAEAIVARGAHAALITGSGRSGDHLYDGARHMNIAVPVTQARATHGSGCTHSATVCAHLARGADLKTAARAAAAATASAITLGLDDVGSGDGPVDVIGLRVHRGARRRPVP